MGQRSPGAFQHPHPDGVNRWCGSSRPEAGPHILTIAVVDQVITRRPSVERLLQRIEGEIAAERAGHAPAHDAAREDIDDEGDVGKAAPGRHVRQIRDPEVVGSRGHKRAVRQVRGARGNVIGERSSF